MMTKSITVYRGGMVLRENLTGLRFVSVPRSVWNHLTSTFTVKSPVGAPLEYRHLTQKELRDHYREVTCL